MLESILVTFFALPIGAHILLIFPAALDEILNILQIVSFLLVGFLPHLEFVLLAPHLLALVH